VVDVEDCFAMDLLSEVDVSAAPDPYGLTPMSKAEVEDSASELGCWVYWPTPDQLTLDIDNLENYYKLQPRMIQLESSGIFTSFVGGWHSRSKGYHFILHLSSDRKVSTERKLMMQIHLGSDPRRETICWRRLMNGERNVSRLFVPNHVKKVLDTTWPPIREQHTTKS